MRTTHRSLFSLLFLAALRGAWSIPETRTFAMLGPAALARAVHVEAQFVRAGFTIRNRHTVTLTQEQGMAFFSDKFSDKQNAENMTEAFSTRAIGVYILQRRSAVAMLKALSGPEEPFQAKAVAPHSIRAKFESTIAPHMMYTSETLAEATSDISHFFPYDKDATVKLNALHQEHQLMPFDVSYLNISLKDLTWLSDHETGAKKSAATTAYDSEGVAHQVESTTDREFKRRVDEEPLRALHVLTDEYIEGLPDKLRNEIHKRRRELELFEAQVHSAST